MSLPAQFFRVHAEKGAAGAGQDQPPDLPPVPAALEALEDGGVLRVHRHDLRPVSSGRRPSPAPRRTPGSPCWPGRCAFPARMAARVGRRPTMPTTAVTTVSASGSVAACYQALRAGAHPDLGVCPAAPPDPAAAASSVMHRQRGAGTAGPAPPAAPRCERAVRAATLKAQLPGHIQGLPADGAGGAQNRNSSYSYALSHFLKAENNPKDYSRKQSQWPASDSQQGATKVTLSNRSRMPPWPGSRCP